MSATPPPQRKGACGHIMAGFDMHIRCARCRDKKKGDDPCVRGLACVVCDALTPQQKTQLSNPVYQKRAQKHSDREPQAPADDVEDTHSIPETEVVQDPVPDAEAAVSTGIQSTSGSPPQLSPVRGRRQSPGRSATSPSPERKKGKRRKLSVEDMDTKLSVFDSSINTRLAKLEALITARLFTPDVSAKVPPTAANPPVSDTPFFPPRTSASVTTTGQLPVLSQPDSSTTTTSLSSAPLLSTGTTRSTGPPIVRKLPVSATVSVPPPEEEFIDADIEEQEQELSEGEISDPHPPDVEITDESFSPPATEEHTYRDTIQGVRSFMGWDHIPNLDSASSAEDNPFQFSSCKPVGKVSIKLPVDDWLCRRFEDLNTRIVSGYPASSAEPSPLGRDQFLRHTATGKWYDVHVPDQEDFPSGRTVRHWPQHQARNNSSLPRVLKAGTSTRPPLSRPISQENLRRWEKASRVNTYIINQTAALSRCIVRIHESLDSQIASLKSSPLSAEQQKIAKELDFLVSFEQTVMTSLQRSITDLSGSVFTDLANLVLLRRDSYLDNLKFGVKPDTIATLRASPLHLPTLFAEEAVLKAEKEITEAESRPGFHTGFTRGQGGRGRGRGRGWKRGGLQTQHTPSQPQVQSQEQQPQQTKAWRQLVQKNKATKQEFTAKAKK